MERENESDDACVLCGKPIKDGEGRFLIKDGAAHIECYGDRKDGRSGP